MDKLKPKLSSGFHSIWKGQFMFSRLQTSVYPQPLPQSLSTTRPVDDTQMSIYIILLPALLITTTIGYCCHRATYRRRMLQRLEKSWQLSCAVKE
jgi:hypothetical protein